MPEVHMRVPFASALLLLTVGAVGVLAHEQWCVYVVVDHSVVCSSKRLDLT